MTTPNPRKNITGVGVFRERVLNILLSGKWKNADHVLPIGGISILKCFTIF
jgi:hypothetical protein